jgi:hypothetical protein
VNRRLRHSARRARKVCGGPHGRHLLKVSELLAKHPRGVALEPVDQLTNRQRRRRIDEHVQVVGPDGKMLNLYAKLFGFLAEQRFKPVRDGSDQHLAASARTPDEMILERDNRPSVVSVACGHKHSVAHWKGRKHVVCDARRRRFILSAKAGGFLASTLVKGIVDLSSAEATSIVLEEGLVREARRIKRAFPMIVIPAGRADIGAYSHHPRFAKLNLPERTSGRPDRPSLQTIVYPLRALWPR